MAGFDDIDRRFRRPTGDAWGVIGARHAAPAAGRAVVDPCVDGGPHYWDYKGGANCGCEDGSCSVPIYECRVCHDCCYGRNAEADEIRGACAARRDAL